jgi:hypothetical protein
MEFKEILQDKPLGHYTNVANAIKETTIGWSDKKGIVLQTPSLHLYCDSESCRGVRLFEHNEFFGYHSEIEIDSHATSFDHCYVEYLCQNCKENVKSYALIFYFSKENDEVDVIKFGEFPQHDTKVPSSLIKIIGRDRDLFIKGQKCEAQGLAVGAFTYYRRVVEGQKNRLIDDIISALQKSEGSTDVIDKLLKAKSETQFSKAIDSIKDLLPKQLYVQGSNPLVLLYKALSVGVHELTDEECLDIAHSVRVILSELSNRLSEMLKDHSELKEAIKSLNKVV